MKTSNTIMDSLVETQTNFVNNWMDSAKKMQAAFASGNLAHEGQALYKEYMDKQMEVLKASTSSFSGHTNNNDPQEFFKNWFNQQAAYAKQMADFTQSIGNSYQSYGKPAQDYMSNFGQANTAFTNIYNSWLNTLNASYDSMSKTMGGTLNKNVFADFMQGSQVYTKMQEFFQPMINAMQKGQFNADMFRNQFSMEQYNELAKQMFGGFYNQASMKEVYDNGIKQLQDFFAGQNHMGKEFFEQVQNISEEFPNLFNGPTANNLKDFYGQVQHVFGKTFEPLLKVVAPGKEKENAEAVIALMDKIAEYSVKQAELQAYLQTTAKNSVEKITQHYAEKYSNPQNLTQLPSAEEMYNEWIKVNEQMFTELFASEEFSKVKGDALNLSMDVKKHFEKQFEQAYSTFPLVFKSEVEDMQKTIYDLKKQVKDLQTKLAMQNAANVELFEEDKSGKARKR